MYLRNKWAKIRMDPNNKSIFLMIIYIDLSLIKTTTTIIKMHYHRHRTNLAENQWVLMSIIILICHPYNTITILIILVMWVVNKVQKIYKIWKIKINIVKNSLISFHWQINKRLISQKNYQKDLFYSKKVIFQKWTGMETIKVIFSIDLLKNSLR